MSEAKLAALRTLLTSYGRVLVAFSGGVDSTFLLKVARDALGKEAVRAVTARSESLPQAELEAARSLAQTIDVKHAIIDTHEIDRADYQANTSERCYFCKTELYDQLVPLSHQWGGAAICDGTNVDDLTGHRPGYQAAQAHGVNSPLVNVGFTKGDIRALSQQLGLPTWDKPALACLSSRIPFGEAVTREKLAQIERGEARLRALGFNIIRVRHHGDVARLEVDPCELQRLADPTVRQQAIAAVKAAGFRFVTLDLEGYRPAGVSQGVQHV